MGVRVKFWKGAWWVFVNTGGRRKAKRVGDRETALRVAQALRERLARREFSLAPATDTKTVQQYATDWLVTAKGALKASTVAFYDGALQQHIVPALGTRSVASLNREDCRSLIATCRAKGLKVSTVRGIARTLSTILTQAVEDQILAANPALRLGRFLRYGDHEEPQPDPLTPDEVTTVLEKARQRFPEWFPFLLCGLRTGMRLGELLEVQWGDINWRSSYVEVRRAFVGGVVTTPKNHQRRRVDLSRQLRAELRLWRRRERAAWLKKGRRRRRGCLHR